MCSPTSPGKADFTFTVECDTPESGHAVPFLCTLWFRSSEVQNVLLGVNRVSRSLERTSSKVVIEQKHFYNVSFK
jgi:hypothetical protein